MRRSTHVVANHQVEFVKVHGLCGHLGAAGFHRSFLVKIAESGEADDRDVAQLVAFVESIPSRTGIAMSISIKSGRCSNAISIASAPLAASTTWNSFMVR